MGLTHKLEDQGPTSPPLPRLATRSHSGENAPAVQRSCIKRSAHSSSKHPSTAGHRQTLMICCCAALPQTAAQSRGHALKV